MQQLQQTAATAARDLLYDKRDPLYDLVQLLQQTAATAARDPLYDKRDPPGIVYS